jgi:hypothetical protein
MPHLILPFNTLHTRNLIHAMTSLGSARVKFTNTWRREPDQQFKIKSLRYPGVILELAHTNGAAVWLKPRTIMLLKAGALSNW